ncbi:MAG: ABC transporter ATP-binding protein [Acidimicrobiaceae bacterium]|nr:ABC transporter ATP-binding protein [Acidimicrobiaceae bacterium]
MSAAIEVENLQKRFRIPLDRSTTFKYRMSHPRSTSRHRDLMALDGVSFEVPEGEFLGIIGANGSGKSTLLKILSRIYRPTSGEVRIHGRASPFLELGVGFNPELTARENVLVNGAILGLSRGELERRMDSILAFAELEEFADQKLKNYSSGMQVRLAFTVAIQADAGILLMDEVLAVGDQRFQAKCFDVFARYRRQGKTVVLVTHDLGAADLHCDRAILLDHGRLVAEGPSSQVTAHYRRMVGEQQDTDEAAQEEGDRWGNGAVRFLSVRLRGEDGSEHRSFNTDETMVLAFELEAQQRVDDLVVGIALHRADGAIVGGTNTLIAQQLLPTLAAGERLSLEYRMETLPLLSGSYRLTVAAHPAVHTVTYDHLEQAFDFAVTDTRGRAGIFELGGAWLVGPETTRCQLSLTG